MKDERPLGFFDMDGTLFDYDGQLRKDLKVLMSPGEVMPEDLYDESKPYLKARMDLIKMQPGWWLNLPEFLLGWDVYKLAEAKDFRVQILTKGPKTKFNAWAEKAECIYRHFGDKVSININGEDKSGNYARFLVDDYPEYIEGWLEHRPRGLVIMPAHPYNADFKHPNVIRYDGFNLKEVDAALDAAKLRKNKEHWREYL